MIVYMSRHYEGLEKSFIDEKKEIFEKFYNCWCEYASLSDETPLEYVFLLEAQLAIEVK